MSGGEASARGFAAGFVSSSVSGTRRTPTGTVPENLRPRMFRRTSPPRPRRQSVALLPPACTIGGAPVVSLALLEGRSVRTRVSSVVEPQRVEPRNFVIQNPSPSPTALSPLGSRGRFVCFATLSLPLYLVSAFAADSTAGADSAPPPAEHWAFRRPVEPPLPEVADPSEARTPIDRFILAALAEQDLEHAPEADRPTLIRRVTYGLTGLPPSTAEIASFIDDPAPDAYERLVDRLLASPRFGERQARHWLDIARYADTKGYVYGDREEARFVHSATYRDWVIRAFNADLPYDRFLIEQIAGDLVRDEGDREPLAAMGFLTVGRRFINNPHDIIDDRIDTLCRATMALTVGCARCHDHKFDPIPAADYYSLYGVFASSSESLTPIESADPGAPAAEAYRVELEKREGEYRKVFASETGKLLDILRTQTAAYLTAVLEVDRLPTEEFYEILSGDELRPFVVRRWHRYLLGFSGGAHPVWDPWHAFISFSQAGFADRSAAWLAENRARIDERVHAALAASPLESMKDVAAAYGRVFDAVLAKVKEESGSSDRSGDVLWAVLFGPDSPIAAPSGALGEIEWFYPEGARVALGRSWSEIERWILASEAAPRHAVHLVDREIPREPRVFRRGNPAVVGEEVPRRMIAVTAGKDRTPFAAGSGRLELARAIASPENPLTARVIVNRIWLWHFGEGLVATPSDFGLRGERPSHPELLDWLAVRLVRTGWSLRDIHRQIVLSSTFRRASADVPVARKADPQNRFLWRMPRRRLEFEELRDTILDVSGRLDLRLYGRPVELTVRPYPTRRSIYGFVDRLNIPGVFRAFDVAGPDQHAPRRHSTTVPQQALFLLNSPFLRDAARALAARSLGSQSAQLTDPVARVRELYRILFGRDPSPHELALGLRATPVLPPEEVAAAVPVPWHYGWGGIDEATGRIASFEPLPHFTGDAWQGGPKWPDATLGWVTLNARGGHTGNDLAHAAIRRFVVPRDGKLWISGRLAHERPEGDGIRARIVSSSAGTLATFSLHHGEVEAAIEALDVVAGTAIDFVVDCGPAGDITWDQFVWAPLVRIERVPGRAPSSAREAGGDPGASSVDAGKDSGAAGVTNEEWRAAAQFRGPIPERLDPWERYAQALLLTNELVFLD
jgi:hypothetical protein